MKRNILCKIVKLWFMLFWIVFFSLLVELTALYKHPYLFKNWKLQTIFLIVMVLVLVFFINFEPSDRSLMRRLGLKTADYAPFIDELDMVYVRTLPSIWMERRIFVSDQAGTIIFKLQQQFGQHSFNIFDHKGSLIGECRIKDIINGDDELVLKISGVTLQIGKHKTPKFPYSIIVNDKKHEIRIFDHKGNRLAVSTPVLTEIGWILSNCDIQLSGNFDRKIVILYLTGLTARWDAGEVRF